MRFSVFVMADAGPTLSGDAHTLAQRLEAVERFPDRNPNPVLRVADDGRLLYANAASEPIMEELAVRVGDRLPAHIAGELREAASEPRRPVEITAGRRTFSMVPVEEAEYGFLNVYGTDITAARVLERFPDWNPNPVMRMAKDGTLLYGNAASSPILRALAVGVGTRFSSDVLAGLRRLLERPGADRVEVHSDGRIYSLVPVLVPELGTVNIYGTDVTALKAIDKFPDQNPNPVLRVSQDGRLQYANPASAPVTKALGIDIGDELPADFRRRVERTAAAPRGGVIELESDGRTFELLVVSVYEFGFVNLYGTDVTAARAVEAANRENERLLLAILPPSIAERLRRGETLIADRFDEMTVLFADLVEFTELSRRLTAEEVVDVLNAVFIRFDELADRHGLEKIKTIGDAYMAVGGLAPAATAIDHPEVVADMGLDMLAAVEQIGRERGHDLRIRIGIHVGPTVAGVIGVRKFIYDVWGETVNVANRMEAHGVPGRIQVTEATRDRLAGSHEFEPRGTVDVKGLGPTAVYLLTGRRR